MHNTKYLIQQIFILITMLQLKPIQLNLKFWFNTNTENEWKNNNSASDLILIPNPAKILFYNY